MTTETRRRAAMISKRLIIVRLPVGVPTSEIRESLVPKDAVLVESMEQPGGFSLHKFWHSSFCEVGEGQVIATYDESLLHAGAS